MGENGHKGKVVVQEELIEVGAAVAFHSACCWFCGDTKVYVLSILKFDLKKVMLS